LAAEEFENGGNEGKEVRSNEERERGRERENKTKGKRRSERKGAPPPLLEEEQYW
jgi:hypothetical protein